MEHGQFWRNKELREHIAVMDEKLSPTIVLKNGVYLNIFNKKWIKANILIYQYRNIYVGDKIPKNLEGFDVKGCLGKYLVPESIEIQTNPYQLYNPEELSFRAGKFGTTTLVNDNLGIFNLHNKKKALPVIEVFDKLPISMFWWGRYDSQTALRDEEVVYNTKNIFDWLENPS